MSHHTKQRSAFWGLCVVAIGAFLLAKSQGYLPQFNAGVFCQSLLIFLGIGRLFTHRFSTKNLYWSFVIIGVGGVFLARNLGYFSFSAKAFWPVMLILVGLYIIFKNIFRPKFLHGCETNCDYHFGRQWESDSILAENELNIRLTMSGGKYISTSKQFKGGRIDLRLAGCELDLSQVVPAQEEIALAVICKLGGLEIRIPQNWTVSFIGSPVMGAFENFTKPLPDANYRLVIRGEMTMAGVKVYN